MVNENASQGSGAQGALLAALQRALAEEGDDYHIAACASYDGAACDCWSGVARAAIAKATERSEAT